MAEPKFKVGDTVYFVNGEMGEFKCEVVSVSSGYQGLSGFISYSPPSYRIQWPPSGGASVSEGRLTSEPTQRLTSTAAEGGDAQSAE